MALKKKPTIVLVCTGLGHVQRGFEMYIASLARKLAEASGLDANVEVWSGGNYIHQAFKIRRIPNFYRNNIISRRLFNPQAAFNLEQWTFALGMLPWLVAEKPAAIYLGEYQLYCLLFKIRKLFGLRFSLVLYTGGQAIPGLFNEKLDYIHHVTDFYLDQCGKIPASRQFLLPHFIEDDFEYDDALIAQLKQQAAGKKIVLSVGIIDRTIKRMDYLVESLSPLATKSFPILLGDTTRDTPYIEKQLIAHFGSEGYILNKVPHPALGSYYRAADLFVLCSPKESFGLANAEAMLHGLPVICDDSREARFVLNGLGHFVSMKSGKALTSMVEKSLLYYSQKEKALERSTFINTHYGWTALKAPYLEMFDTIISN